MSEPLEVSGVTVTRNEQGALLQDGFFVQKQIDEADAIKLRDWLNENFPKK